MLILRRLTIGVELASKPELLMFLDVRIERCSSSRGGADGIIGTDLWPRLRGRLQHYPTPEEARGSWPSDPLHDSSAV